ncbi:MAG TPA: dihydroorotate dehydrogenase-like protein [Thermosynergistes sp.]|nr:dihydroorotate dehydrogenase-like protein [Thermosynergistes sp.]
MTDLSTTYLGLKLKNPLVASASPLTKQFDNIKRLEEAGVGAIVLHSLFEEELIAESIRLHEHLEEGTESFPEALTYFPELPQYGIGPESYLKLIEAAKGSTSMPIIASLNAASPGKWADYARRIEESGADALELNVYTIPTDPLVTSSQVEEELSEIVKDVCEAVEIPVAVKLSPFYSSIPCVAKTVTEAGAEGITIFNRFYQPDLDIKTMDVVPRLELSTSQELLLRLRWAAIISPRIKADIAITGGVHKGEDIAKCILAGAKVAMVASALLKNGISHASIMLEEFRRFLEEKRLKSAEEIRGHLSQRAVANPKAFERANYVKLISSY